jgi:hypothetical protein
MRNSLYSAQISETAWRKSRAEQDWDGSDFSKLAPVTDYTNRSYWEPLRKGLEQFRCEHRDGEW